MRPPASIFRFANQLRIPGIIAFMMVLNACHTSSSGTAGAPTAHYIVSAEDTAFYKNGPAQPNGPDMRLYKGQQITMLERHYGFSRVETVDGQAGYVPTEDITPAPNAPKTAEAQSRKHGGTGAARSSPGRAPDFDQPNDAALPSRQAPSDEPAPSFRY
jgi:hypothetical protein